MKIINIDGAKDVLKLENVSVAAPVLNIVIIVHLPEKRVSIL